MTSVTLESASGVLSLLKSEDPRLKAIALKKIDKYMDHYWHEIAERVADIEALHEDESFRDRQLAALIASKLYYHLEDYNEAVNFALQAGSLFDIHERTQYVDCLIGKCIDRYISERQNNFERVSEEGHIAIDSKLEDVVEKIFNRCIQEKESKMVLGLALDARRVDKISEILKKEEYSSEILDYLTRLARNVVASRKFRVEIFKIIVDSYQQRAKNTTDYINLSQSYFILDDSKSLAELLLELVKTGHDEQILLAYQIATDINENENNFYFEKVIEHLHKTEGLDPAQSKSRENLVKILSGRFKNELYLTFLKEKNQADPAVVNQLKTLIDIKNSVGHGGVVFANGLINAGTTNDAFLRTNIEWVAKASHWAKFSATASLGVIHKGNYSKAMQILQPYFPGSTATPSWYTHGGSLYGLGLIHYGDKDRDVINYLIQQIKSPDHNDNEQIIHGACLGLGMVSLASENEEHRTVYEDLKNVLFTDSANTGEAAGLAIGMSMLGSAAKTVIDDLLDYAHETQHEKIIRSIALALAFIMYGKEEKADALIDQLSLDKDGILRYGAMYMIGLAYIGTSNNAALKKLLLFAVSDVSDDVRRAAVINVGLIMLKQPEQVPKILSLLAMSYNANVRYGATLALGIACAGTAQQEALKMLEPMLNDSSDFVRQGAYLATAMILQQATVAMEPKVEKFRTQLEEIVKKKHEDPLARLGALLSFGILDAGGRNASISLVSQFGYPKIASVVGVVLFLHFWYWFPTAHSILLTFSPTCLIGVNKDLKVPKGFQYKSNAKPSLYAYPEHVKENKEKEKAKVTTAQLSITQKVKARALARNQSTTEPEETKKEEKMDIEPTEEKKKEEEPDFSILENPSRVLPRQRAAISFLDDNRYKPILKERKSGILFLLDTKAGHAEEFFGEEAGPKPTTSTKPEESHIPVPEAFKYEDDDEGETQKLLK